MSQPQKNLITGNVTSQRISKHQFIYVSELWSFCLAWETTLFQVEESKYHQSGSPLPQSLTLTIPLISHGHLSTERRCSLRTLLSMALQAATTDRQGLNLLLKSVHPLLVDQGSAHCTPQAKSSQSPSFWMTCQLKMALTFLNGWNKIRRRIFHDT